MRRNNYRNNLLRGIKAGYRVAKTAYDMRRSLQKQRTRKNVSNTFSGVTTQHDVKRVYKKKYMPSRKRRQWKKFTKKVKAAIDDRGTKTVVFNDLGVFVLNNIVASIRRQQYNSCHLYAHNGTLTADELGSQDLKRIFDNDTSIGTTGKIVMKSAVLDLTFTNVGTGTYSGPLEVDVYELQYNRGAPSNYNSGLAAIFNTGIIDTGILGAATNKPDLSYRGVTLFDNPDALSDGKIKIVSKTKHIVSNTQSFTYQVRDPRNYTLEKDTFTSAGFINNMTKSVMFIVKPTMATVATEVFGYTVGCTRSYKYTREGSSTTESAYIV